MPSRGSRVLIAGVSTRALAASAARAGCAVTAIDAFGDVDLRAVADVVALTRADGGFRADTAARIARPIPADFVIYTSTFENHPGAVAALAAERCLLGNPPEVLRRVRDPLVLMRALAARGLPTPVTRSSAPREPGRPGAWLLKPRRSGGGHGTSVWRPGVPVSRRAYVQQRIRGVPGSIVFLAAGGRIHVLGLTRQLVGDRAFGAAGFRYCGSLLGSVRTPLFADDDRIRRSATDLATAAAEAFGLIGLNGVDFIARGGTAWPLEVNPRPTGSMELVERADGVSLFELHAAACAGRLPPASECVSDRPGVCGKAIVFARRDVVVRDPAPRWEDAADLPHPGERIGPRHPICTVFAQGSDPAACLGALAASAQQVYATVEPRAGRAGAA